MKKLICLRNLVASVAAGLLLLVLPVAAQAQSLKMDLNEMAAAADTVITGTVVGQKSWWNAERSHIFTSVEMTVLGNVKGTPQENKVFITVPGGDVGGIREYVTDTPAFFPGEDVLVFLKQRDGENHVLGGYQGKFDVADGSIGRVPLAEFKRYINGAGPGFSLPGDIQTDIGTGVFASSGPTVDSITPASASAGTDERVTVNGSGFGAASGKVYFFYRNGQPRIEGEIISWSDTSIVTTVPAHEINGYSASAGSGPVYIRTGGGADSNSVPFTVTFSYGKIKWAGGSPVFSYRINPNTADCIGEEAAVKNAANTWNSVSGKTFAFNYAGSTTAKQGSYNGKNEICWTNMGGGGTLASTSIWYSGGTILECDIEFNDYYDWSPGQLDIQSLALHEFGHCLNLNDLYGLVDGYPNDSIKVMYGFGSPGELKRSLHSDDQDGIRWIYPAGISPPSVQTDNPTDITANTVTLNGNITSNGGGVISEYGFYWGPTTNPATRVVVGTDNNSGLYNYHLSALAPGIYYFKAYATNSAGTGYGEVKSATIGINPQKGDVNGDNRINVQDIVLTVNIILGKVTPSASQRYAADVNSDNVINVQDTVAIVNIILGETINET